MRQLARHIPWILLFGSGCGPDPTGGDPNSDAIDTGAPMDMAEAVDALTESDGTPSFPRISVTIDAASIGNGGSVTFPTQLQMEIARSVTIGNPGDHTLHVDSVAWDVDNAGRVLKNPYVELDLAGGTVPGQVAPGQGLTFTVRLTPPIARPMDDFSESVLLIRSDALDDAGQSQVPAFRVVFGFSVSAAPRVTPSSYVFRNASPSHAERQEFRIYNDELLGTAAFRVLDVTLESPSSELLLDAAGVVGATVLAPSDPRYGEAIFAVTYQPVDGGADANAILIRTDVGETLRVPLSSEPVSEGGYSLAYSDPRKFDFSNEGGAETRSVALTCQGPAAMVVMQPYIEPDSGAFAFTAWALSAQVGSADVELTSWPRALNVGRSIRFDVRHSPPGVPAVLVIPIANPEGAEIRIPLTPSSG